MGWAAICRQPGPVWSTGECTGEKDKQNIAVDQMALKPASSGEREICQNQVFQVFLSFFFLVFLWAVHCKGSDMSTAV